MLPFITDAKFMHVIALCICAVVAFVSLLCSHFGLKFVAAVVCTVALKMGSSTPVAWACLLHGFIFINT